MLHRKGTSLGDTFIVNIKKNQNHTWQGNSKVGEKQEEIPFRSAIELIRLIDSALELSEGNGCGEQTEKW